MIRLESYLHVVVHYPLSQAAPFGFRSTIYRYSILGHDAFTFLSLSQHFFDELCGMESAMSVCIYGIRMSVCIWNQQ
jgi:hypothetical protein